MGGQLPEYYAKDSEVLKYVSSGSAGEFNPPSYNAQILGGKYTSDDIDTLYEIARNANLGMLNKIQYADVNCSNVEITTENNGHYVSDNISFYLPINAMPITAYPIGEFTAGVSVCSFDTSNGLFKLQSDISLTLPSDRYYRVIYFNNVQ